MRKLIVTGGIFILFCLLSFEGYTQKKADYTNLRAEDFYEKMNQSPDALIIDVRLKPDYEEKRIPGAVPADEPEKLNKIIDPIDKNTPLLVYCYDGERSGTACEILTKEHGFYNVYNLKKGLERWEKLGFPTVKNAIEEEGK